LSCGRTPVLLAALTFTFGVALAATAAGREPMDVAAGPPEESGEVDEPTFPRVLGREALRIWLESRFEPDADFGEAELGLAKPGARGRLRMPVSSRASVQLSGGFAANLYDADGKSQLFAGCPECPAPDEFYASSLGLQAALLLNDDWHLIGEDAFALLGEAFGRARWEPGAFDDSLTGGGALGLGYELPDKLRIAVGVRVESALDGGSPAISPSGTFRWDVTPWLRLRNRGFGAQLELRPIRRLEVFAAGFRASDRFRLHSRSGLADDAVFRDRQWLVGGGIQLKLHRMLRLVAEGGAIVDRQISLRARGEGTLDTTGGDPSPYAELRIEIRP
jgi:hypothetical protein